MQSDTGIVDDKSNDDDDDDGSLFGSPPPSPSRGRSPFLALPSGTQNVGTIALPGSHLYSELPVNPLASSLSRAAEQAHRPPAQNIQNQIHIPTCTFSRPPSNSPSNSESSSRAPSVTVRRQKAKERERKSTPRPALPPIPFPDPGAPPPINFLRNQQALLGTAGLVGGVNPATLSVHRHMRGSTSSNPIVVEDELNIPHIGCKTRLPPPVDPALLPTPSTEEIIASLIKQKNIFPVLESILKFIATNDSQNTAPPARSAFERSNRSDSEGPPGKKRKLGSVPAGAVDWDVPYPFSDGEGPHAYRTNWEKERGKQLINQLVGLIKSAARTAATRTYFQQQQGERRSHTGYYRPATATYGLMDPPQVLADNSNINIVHVPPHNAHPTPRPGSPSLDQFVASLLQSPEQSSISAEPVQGSSVLTQDSDIPSGSLTPDFDQGLFDNWLSLLRAFPIPQLPISNQNNVKTSLLTNVTTSSGSTYEPPINAIDTNALPAHDLMLDFAIDPALLAMSVPQAQLSSFSSGGPVLPPGPLPSPMASTSSLTDPLTPNWDHTFPEPDIFFTDQAEDPMTAANMLLQLGNPSSFINQPPSKPPPPPTQPLSYCSPPPPSLPTPSTLTAKSWTTAVPSFTVAPGRSGASKPSAREDILLRAREQRRQLSAEIARAKVELWEATIEQGVLAQILKDKV